MLAVRTSQLRTKPYCSFYRNSLVERSFFSDFHEHAAPDHVAKMATHRKCYASLSALRN